MGGSRWSFDVREKGEKRWWCTVERLSARDHLVTRKSEGREEPLGSDGTTRHGRGKKWRAEDPGVVMETRFCTVSNGVLEASNAKTKFRNGFRRSKTCRAYFRVPFTCLWIGRPESPVRKASANVRECPGLSRRLLKCARSLCSHVRAFASDCRVMNSNSSFGREPFVGADGPKWGADSLLHFVCMLD
ncbi:hypothetical protein CRG98_016045 [Punica granatum]|uniref:Uncharacterized protein n=1 Tax=Punica granatum TaxID=22663 RepID=A0A2I0K4U8_PUNGR|nr:hypothetical protein CRG98_016045 [Punica granatum]